MSDGIATKHGQSKHHCRHHSARHTGHIGRPTRNQQAEHTHQDLPDQHRVDERPDNFWILRKQRGAWENTVDQQAAEQHCGRRRSGDRQRQQRHQRRANHGVVCAFRGDDTLWMAGAEFSAFRAHLLGLVIGNKTRDLSTHTGDQTNDRTYGCADGQRTFATEHLAKGGPNGMALHDDYLGIHI